jgi:type II secretory pathway component PulJ
MVAMVISLIASTAMILLMANTLGTGTQAIQMTRLSQEMRTAMHLITRDLRRANYHANFADCFGNPSCNPDNTKIMAVVPNDTGTCFRFWYDRGNDGVLDVGAFQMVSVTRRSRAVNVLQMTTLNDAGDVCGDGDWGMSLDITNRDSVNVTAFTVSAAESYNEPISATDTQDVSKIRITMTAELRDTPQGIPISKTIEGLIYVRNNIICPGGVCPGP